MASNVHQLERFPVRRERPPPPLLAAGAVAAVVAAGGAALALLDALGAPAARVALGPTVVVALLLALVAAVVAQRHDGRALRLENERLRSASAVATRELRASRARIAASAERERRRIERDLHDGAQQRLVALRIELGLAEELVARDPVVATARLRELEGEVDDALEELRALAHGVYPPLLADRGLAEALRANLAHAALPVTLHADGIGRCPPEVEDAVYFCVLEAVQNACKHAVGARGVRVSLGVGGGEARGVGALRVEIADDGAGLPCGGAAPGAGIANMRDRLAAVGGRLELVPARSGGCAIRLSVPVPSSVTAVT